MSSEDAVFDVAIVGAGLNGLASAVALKSKINHGLRVVIIAPEAAAHVDIRTTALTPHSKDLLEQWGVWDKIADFALPITAITLTDSNRADPVRIPTIRFTPEDNEADVYFYMVENGHLLSALLALCRQLPLQWITSEVETHTVMLDYAELSLRNGQKIHAKLIVAADGAQSPIRAREGINLIQNVYEQSAITCVLAHEKPHHAKAWQHFFETGPLAFLPLSSSEPHPHRTSIVWSLSPEEAEDLCQKPDALLEQIQRIQGAQCGVFTYISQPTAYPLVTHVSAQFHAPRIVLVGDSAHRIHPMAGQGFNMGLKDCAALTNVTDDMANLAVYTQARKSEVNRLHTGQNALNFIMCNPSIAHRAMRHLGENLFNRFKLLKKLAMRVAAGH